MLVRILHDKTIEESIAWLDPGYEEVNNNLKGLCGFQIIPVCDAEGGVMLVNGRKVNL
jgi:hypothetical protein